MEFMLARVHRSILLLIVVVCSVFNHDFDVIDILLELLLLIVMLLVMIILVLIVMMLPVVVLLILMLPVVVN